MVTAAAGSDAAVVLVDITKLDCASAPGAAAAADAPPRAAGAPAARAEHRVRGQQARRGRPTRRRPSPRCARRCSPLPHEAGIDVAGIVPVSALRGDNVDAAARRATGTTARRCCSCWRRLPTAQERNDGDLLRAGAVRRPRGRQAPATSRARCGAASRTAACRPATRCRCSRAARRATVAEVRRGRRGGRRRARPASRPASCSTASSTCRAATGSPRPAPLHATQRFAATLAWLDTEPAAIGRKYWLRHGNRWVQARITAIEQPARHPHAARPTDAHELAVNEIGRVIVETQQPLPVERLCRQPRRRCADRRRPGQQPHQRRAAGRSAAA